MTINSYSIKQMAGIAFMLFLSFSKAFSQSKDSVLELLWTGLGGKEVWEDANFFMFTCNPATNNLTKGSHTYIWNKKNGKCRFEGILPKNNDKLVVLFNSDGNSGQVYINDKRVSDRKVARTWLEYASSSFRNDCFWLFPQLLISNENNTLEVLDQELIGSKKYLVLQVSGSNTNKFFIDINNGQVFRRDWYGEDGTQQQSYLCMRYKDVGGGLQLATFLNDPSSNKSISYPIVSALVNVEAKKFSNP